MLCLALGTSVFSDGCKTVEGIARVADEWIRAGPLLGLFALAFKILIDQTCRQDQHSSTGFVVAIVAAMNTHSCKSLSEMRILCIWRNLRVSSIKLEHRPSTAVSPIRRVHRGDAWSIQACDVCATNVNQQWPQFSGSLAGRRLAFRGSCEPSDRAMPSPRKSSARRRATGRREQGIFADKVLVPIDVKLSSSVKLTSSCKQQ